MKRSAYLFILLFLTGAAQAQVVVNGHDLNENDSLQYIQLSFFYEGKDMLPVYALDYGEVISNDEEARKQQISVDGESITNNMTPMNVLNKLYRAGWEYLGDAVFMRAPIVENTQTFTLKRRRTD